MPKADPSLIARFNREWHVVVENAPLAKAFQVYLEHDFRTASAAGEEAGAVPVTGPDLLIPVEEFLREEAAASIEVFAPRKFSFTNARPLTVQPILTPDNYLEVVLKLLRKRPEHKSVLSEPIVEPRARSNARVRRVVAACLRNTRKTRTSTCG